MKRLIVLGLIIIWLSACTITSPNPPITAEPSEPSPSLTPFPTPENPYTPQEGDKTLSRAMAMMNSATLLTMESFPVQIQIVISGELPTPCHSLRAIVHQPDTNNNIDVEIYSVADPNEICEQVIQSFNATIPMGSFPGGHYTVSVNGEPVGDFNS